MGRSRGEAAWRNAFGAAGRRPNRGCGPRAAAGAARHNVTKPSSIYMWAYTGKNILSALPSKIFPGVISHMVSKGGVQGFNKKNDY